MLGLYEWLHEAIDQERELKKLRKAIESEPESWDAFQSDSGVIFLLWRGGNGE